MTVEIMLSDRQQRNNIARLATAQALSGANSVVFYATGAIAGNSLAPASSLATLPVTVFVIGMAACILPFGWLAKKYGRRAAFMGGTFAGMLTGILAALAVVISSFSLFCLAAFAGGAYAAVALSFRFAATDGVSPQQRAKALSLVMGGGVMAGIIGPMLVSATMGLWPAHLFSATYIAQAVVALLSAIVLYGVQSPPVTEKIISSGRSLHELVRQPGFAITVFSGAVTYMIMNFLMTAAPLSMKLHGLSQQASNLGIQWHVIAMYGPGFFTGRLIGRFGARAVTVAGLLISTLAVLAGLTGTGIASYWLSLILLGLGWNFGFTGASAQIIHYHQPAEKNTVQSLNDFVVFSVMIVGSFSSGALLNLAGWHRVLLGSLVPLGLALAALLATGRRRTAE